MIYLDNAATTFPKPEAVYEQTFRFIRESLGNPGRAGHGLSVAAGAAVEDARRLLARFFGVSDPHRLIFTAGCTDSINMALRGLLSPGDHVIASALDHNAVSRPLEELRLKNGLDVTRVAFGEDALLDPAEVRRGINRNTKIIVLTHGSNVLGSVQPLEPFVEIARDAGIPLLLDAAQTAGVVPVREDGAPVLIACAAHKGLFGLPGLGILTVPAGLEIRKWRVGGTGTLSENLLHPEELPLRLEAGTSNSPAIVSAATGVEFIASVGMEKIHSHETCLAARLHRFLRDDPRFEIYSKSNTSGKGLGTVAFNLKGVASQEVAAILDQSFGIAVRGGLHCAAVLHQQLGTVPDGCLRVSPGYFNTADQIETLISALGQIASGY